MEKKTIRQLRNERNVSREALAVAVGISFPTLVRIETGRAKPRIDIALDIAKYFGVPVEAIDWGEQVAAAA